MKRVADVARIRGMSIRTDGQTNAGAGGNPWDGSGRLSRAADHKLAAPMHVISACAADRREMPHFLTKRVPVGYGPTSIHFQVVPGQSTERKLSLLAYLEAKTGRRGATKIDLNALALFHESGELYAGLDIRGGSPIPAELLRETRKRLEGYHESFVEAASAALVFDPDTGLCHLTAEAYPTAIAGRLPEHLGVVVPREGDQLALAESYLAACRYLRENDFLIRTQGIDKQARDEFLGFGGSVLARLSREEMGSSDAIPRLLGGQGFVATGLRPLDEAFWSGKTDVEIAAEEAEAKAAAIMKRRGRVRDQLRVATSGVQPPDDLAAYLHAMLDLEMDKGRIGGGIPQYSFERSDGQPLLVECGPSHIAGEITVAAPVWQAGIDVFQILRDPNRFKQVGYASALLTGLKNAGAHKLEISLDDQGVLLADLHVPVQVTGKEVVFTKPALRERVRNVVCANQFFEGARENPERYVSPIRNALALLQDSTLADGTKRDIRTLILTECGREVRDIKSEPRVERVRFKEELPQVTPWDKEPAE
ncbi:hypothetical protein ACFL31_02200 [Candidatus Margulisiibacteriota bacterium]